MTDMPSIAPSRVRFADPCDFDDLIKLCRALHEENGLFALSEDRVKEMLLTHYDRSGGIIGVIGDPGKIEGAIVMRMSQKWYSDEWYLEELFNFVYAEYRRSSNAKDLIDFARSCAVRIGVALLIGIVSNKRTEAKVELYRRKLGPAAGAFFLANPRATTVAADA